MAPLNIKVITTWNNKLFEEYAHRFQETYNWPFELIVYNEDDEILPDLKKMELFLSSLKLASSLVVGRAKVD